MCGIAGFLGRFDPDLLSRMGDRIAHRGPDDVGIMADSTAGIGLVHRRLSIVDPSSAGHQPMRDASGRYVICYNGELYNAPELRNGMAGEGATFRGHSDTEVLLEFIARRGLGQLHQLNGIFAFALWDTYERLLHLVRDGMGVKPLYVTHTAKGMAFASELKALLALDDLSDELDPIAATAYLSYLYSPGERTMLKAVKKLEPGTCVTYSDGRKVDEQSFYRLPFPVPVTGNDAELIQSTRDALDHAVERQMLADVEIGAFLSGGLDSSAIVASLRRQQPDRRLRCFTINYTAGPGDEAEMISDLPYARAAARHLGVELIEVQVDGSMAQSFEQLIYMLDEPQADPAALNNFFIARSARDLGIKVLLSGAGGDDLFTGYRRHQAANLDAYVGHIPQALRRAVAAMALKLPVSGGTTRRIRKALSGIGASETDRVMRLFEWLAPEHASTLLNDGDDSIAQAARQPFAEAAADPRLMSAVERALRLDQRFFLTDHNLNYTDKTGMAVGVEIRVPFLDPDLMAWAARIPLSAKIRKGQTKWVLRQAMEPRLPHDIIYRPKTGFGVPLRAWMRRELKPLMDETLSPAVIEARGLFSAKGVAQLRKATDEGTIDGSYPLLGVASIELWCRHFIDNRQ